MTGVRRRAMLFYDGLSVSSGGAHTLRERDPRTAWDKFDAFLEACCQVEKCSTWLQLYERIDLPVRPKGLAGLLSRGRAPEQDRSAEPLRKAATAAFGHPNRIDARIVAAGWRINQWEWRFEQSRMGHAMRILVENPVPDVEDMPAALLCVKTRFLLKDPATGEVLPWQDPACYGNTPGPAFDVRLGESGWFVRLGPRTTCSLCLSLPFEEAGEDAVALAGRLQEHLPFKLSPHHWTRWQLNKAGTGYCVREVAMGKLKPTAGPAAGGPVLYRPMGQKELDLVAASGWRAFPPRLPEQPVFYPVLNFDYACQVNRWNVDARGVGYVVRFRVDDWVMDRYPPQIVGGRVHEELWVPAEELEEFNRHILGEIEVVAESRKGDFSEGQR